jgi:cytochrome c oxidase assembly protein subunit 15
MSEGTQNRWLNWFAVFTAITTLALIGLGGLVTSHGVGMAVPDWPNTYGYNLFMFPISQWIGGVFYEHTHRLLASFVGLLTTVLAMWLWIRETKGSTRASAIAAMVFVIGIMGVRKMPVFLTLASIAPIVIGYGIYRFMRDQTSLRWLGLTAFAAVILQGVLGGLRVVWIKDEIGIFHAMLAQMFFVLTATIALFTSRTWTSAIARNAEMKISKGARRIVILSSVLILTQLILGACMRHQHAGLAVPDFPMAYGKLWPDTDQATLDGINMRRIDERDFNGVTAFHIQLHMTHRIVALTILVMVCAALWRLKKELGPKSRVARMASVWLGMIVFQASLGALTVWSNKAADVATLHVVVGALSLVVGSLISITILKFSFAVKPQVIHSPGDLSVMPVSNPKTA